MSRSHVEDNYKCIKHNSTYGYKDESGKWNCWACYNENLYRHTRGEIIDTYTSKGVEARLVLSGTHSVFLEIWNITEPGNEVMIDSLAYNYLSQATREWHTIVSKLENGVVNSNSRSINFEELFGRRARRN